MERRDNYRIQFTQAKQTFLKLDQNQLINKLQLKADAIYLYPCLMGSRYRIHRQTADFQRLAGERWVDANTHSEVMTLLDLICDSREDRNLSFRWKDMVTFGSMFHRSLQETDPWALRFQKNPEELRRACVSMGGVPFPNGDVAYVIEVFDGLSVVLQLWLADEEFPPSLRLLWDENALMYLKYETMYFAKALLLTRLWEYMQKDKL